MNTPADGRGALLQVCSLQKVFPVSGGIARRVRRAGRRVARAVDDVTFELGYGETLGVVGESGSGKTTLARLILGLTEATEGTILFGGTDVTHVSHKVRRGLCKDIQGVFQDPYSSLDPRQKVRQIIQEPLDIHGLGTPAGRRERVADLMQQVALPSQYADSYPHELSGGLRQRVGIATALAVRPKLIVADEPVSALDVSVQAQIIRLLSDIQRKSGIAIIFISHDLSVVREVCSNVAVMCLGRVVERGPTEQVYRAPHHPYTRALLSAVLPTDPGRRYEPIKLTGEPPSPLEPLTGCVFRTRCWLAEEVCEKVVPRLLEYEAGHDASCHVSIREWRSPAENRS